MFFYKFATSSQVKLIYYRCNYFLNDIYLFLERGKGREKERERNINVWLPLTHPPNGDLACNPGMYPDWELNQQPFGSQASAQPTEPHQPGHIKDFVIKTRALFVPTLYIIIYVIVNSSYMFLYYFLWF